MRDRLLAWQWSDYTAKHRDRGNLLLHAVAVPMFLLSTVLLVTALVTREGVAAVFAVAGMGVSVLLQGRGHQREDEAPTPFAGAGDFVTRFFVEQWVTFPRFVLSGGWLRNFWRGRGEPS
jgi:phage terminase small subunit